MIEIRIVEKIVPEMFFQYLKMFKKKNSEKMLIKKPVIFCILASSIPIHE